MKTYCPNCGSVQQRSLEKVKFCYSCGKPLNSEGRSLLASQELEEDEEPSLSLNNMSKLDVEIQKDRSDSIKLGELMATALEEGTGTEGEDYDRPEVNREKVLAELKKEAGTLKPRNESKKK